VNTPAPDPREQIAAELAELASALPGRVDIDPDQVGRDLGKLVLTLVELIRQVVEHQAIQRMDDTDLTAEQVERMGIALLRLEEKTTELRELFGLAAEDLNVDLGPLGRLL
jgi:hypothetical protein